MNLEEKKALVQKWYESLRTSNVALFQSVHAANCVYNISGHSPISGQVGMADLMEHVLPLVLGSLKMDEYKFCIRQAIVCADDNRIVGIDAAIFMHPTVWKASGHVDAFNDPMIDDRQSKMRYRADQLIEGHIDRLRKKGKDADAVLKPYEEMKNWSRSNPSLKLASMGGST